MNMRAFISVLLVALLGTTLVLAGCGDNEGPMEKAGEKIDNTIHDATHEGPMEKAGEQADKAWDSTKEAVENVGKQDNG